MRRFRQVSANENPRIPTPSLKRDRPSRRFPRLTRPGLLLLLTLSTLTVALAAQSDKDTSPLEPGKPVERELAGGQSHNYRIELTSGQYIHLVVDQRGVDVVVTVFGPDGKQFLEVDGPTGTQGEEAVFGIAADTGTHRLEVRSLEKGAPAGRYEVKIRELRTSTQRDVDGFQSRRAFEQAGALRAQGTTESLQGALKKYEEALSLFRRWGERHNEAATLLAIGRVHDIAGDKGTASKFYQQALPIFRAIGDRSQEAVALNNIGLMLMNMGDSQGAIEHYQQALPIIKELNERRTEAMILGNLGSAHSSLGDQQKALDYFLQVLPVLRDAGDSRTVAALLNNIGGLYKDIGNKTKALEYYLQALSIFREVGDRRGETAVLTNVGGAYLDLGNNQKALEFLELALTFYKSFKNTFGEATALNNIGSAYLRLNNLEKALEYYKLAQPLRKASGDQRGEAWTLNNVGSVYERLGDRRQALDYYKKALLLWITVNNPGGEAHTLGNLMSLSASLDNPRSAVFYGKRAVNLYQRVRSNIRSLDKDIQKTYLASVERAYRGLAAGLMSQGRPSEAQQVLNAFKDQQFFDFDQTRIGELRPLTRTPREGAFVVRYEEAGGALGVVGGKVAELKRKLGGRRPTEEEAGQLRQLEAQLATATGEFSDLLKQAEAEFSSPADEKDEVGEVSDATQMQATLRQLKKDTGQTAVAVYTLAGETKFYALVVTADDITSVSSAVTGDELNKKARALWGLLQSDAYDPAVLSNDLYRAVFKPIEAKLPGGTKTILWSLDGNLRYVPMAALHDGRRYLIERYNHVNFTRADAGRMTRAVTPDWTATGLGTSAAHTVELLGNKITLDALPGVGEELRLLVKQKDNPHGIFDGETLQDAKFTKTTMLSALRRKRPLIHIASHFAFRPGDEHRSFLLVGDGTALTLAEMTGQENLFDGVELLTLSACNTAALQPGANGREVDAFAELAQRLGANAVMATLWPVADSSTPWLMREFYQTRRSQALNKAEALRRAQLALLNGMAGAKPLPATHGRAPGVQVLAENIDGRDGDNTRAELIFADAQTAAPFKKAPGKPFSHPYYWAPFILIGNWR
jgi:CHAT domain-containing protein/tetratricopeptide (TPR) repeat protein